MMEIMIESAGAHSGFLLQDDAGQLLERTRAHVDGAERAKKSNFSPGVVNLVRRTHETVVLSDAMRDATFGTEAHVEAVGVRSLLCMPMLRQDSLVGVLYFENSLPDAFTPERVEIVEILAAQAAVSLENATLYEEVHALNKDLEARVAERTAELARKNANIRAMFGNLGQGICIVLDDGAIDTDYSHHLEEMMGTTNIAGRNVWELLFEGAAIGADQLATAKAVFAACMRMPALNFELNAHLFIQRYERSTPEGSRVFELDWVPLVSEGVVERVLLTVRDATELRELREQQVQLRIVGQLIELSTGDYNGKMESLRALVADCDRAMNEAKPTVKRVERAFRALHTLKGEARGNGWTEIANAAHQAESALRAYRGREAIEDLSALDKPVSKLGRAIDQYAHVWESTLGRASLEAGDLVVSREWLDSMLRVASRDGATVDELRARLAEVAYSPLDAVLEEPLIDAGRSAGALGKSPPTLKLTGSALRIDVRHATPVRQLFMHLVTNSLVHGIEPDDERRKLDKPVPAAIHVDVSVADDRVVLRVWDDGQGLQLGRLRTQLPDQSDDEYLEAIFRSGVSTQANATQLAGRGVGLDAVRRIAGDLGGRIVSTYRDDAGPDSRSRPIELALSLPADLFEANGDER